MSKALPSPASQQGVALITVLLLVVVATVLAASMAKDQNIAVHRTRNYLDLLQVKEYALGGEEVARQLLMADFQQNPAKDYGGENWASEELEFEFNEGHVQLRIWDLQGKFNLNSLADASSQGAINHTRFRLLLNLLGIDPAFSDRITDWIDQDQNTRPLGAEDYHYLGLDLPYRTASIYMADVSELRLITGMDDEVLNSLLPYVTVLPTDASTINVNTAGEYLLLSLAPNLSPSQIEQTMQLREPDGFNDLQEFTQGMGSPSNLDTAGLSVSSIFFQVEVLARYGDRFGYLTSILERSAVDGTMRVIYRDWSRKLLPVTT